MIYYVSIILGSIFMKSKQKIQAILLRKKGYSINEIYLKTGIAKSTASLWVRNVKLSLSAKERLKSRGDMGRKNGTATNLAKRIKLVDEIEKEVSKNLKVIKLNISTRKLLCAMLYWGEGSKDKKAVHFINSDPLLIKTFLSLFRSSFDLEENKFRVNVHLHSYHDKEKQLKYWSNITNIPRQQFMKPFIKPNSGKNIKKGYPGCAAIYYFDYKIAIELNAFWELFGKNLIK